MEGGIPSWLSIILFVLVLIVAIGIWALMLRNKYLKEATGRIKCEFLTAIGTTKVLLLPYEGQEVIAPKPNNEPGTMRYVIREDATYLSKHPESAWFPLNVIVTTQIKKAFYLEGNPEPIVKRRDDDVMSDRLIGNLRDEKFTDLAVMTSTYIKDLEDKIAKSLNPMVVYIMLGVVVLVSILGAIFSYQVMQSISSIKAGLGII